MDAQPFLALLAKQSGAWAISNRGSAPAQHGQALARGAEWRSGDFNPPDVITHSVLISACEKSKHLQQALELFEAMQ